MGSDIETHLHTPKAVAYHEQPHYCRFMIGHSLGHMESRIKKFTPHRVYRPAGERLVLKERNRNGLFMSTGADGKPSSKAGRTATDKAAVTGSNKAAATGATTTFPIDPHVLKTDATCLQSILYKQGDDIRGKWASALRL